MASRLGGLLLFAALIVGACGSSETPTANLEIPAEDQQTESPEQATALPDTALPDTALPDTEPTQVVPADSQPTSTPENVTEADIIQFYREAVDALTGSGQPPNPEYGPLLERVAEPLLTRVVELRDRQRGEGQYLEGTSDRHITVTSLTDTDAIVRVCMLDQVVRYSQAGEVESPADTDYKVIVAALKLEDGVWKIYESFGEGEPCDPADFT